jgi:hypothetical protein
MDRDAAAAPELDLPPQAQSGYLPRRNMSAMRQLRRLALAQGGLPVVWVGLSILLLLPVWHQRLLPMLDTPNHLALARAWHSFHDASFKIADFYELRVKPLPYFLFYFSIHALMYLFPIEVANKVFLSAYLLLFPLSVLVLTRVLKRSPWLALCAFPIAFNPNWIYGFSSYLMSTCFMFLSFAALIRWLREHQQRDLGLLFLYCMLCYLAHVLTWFVFGLGAIGLLVLYRRRWRAALWAAAAMFPTVILGLCSAYEESNEHAFVKAAKFEASWHDFPTLVIEFPRRVLEIFPGNLDMVVLAVVAATTLVLLFRFGTRLKDQDALEHQQLPLLLYIMGAAYLLLPYHITSPMQWFHVTQRVPSMMAPLLFLLPAVPATAITRQRRLLLVPLIVASLVLPIKLAVLYKDFSRRNQPFMYLVSKLPRGARVLVVYRGMMRGQHSEEKSGDPVTSGPVYWQFSSWPMALNGGYSPYLFDQGIPVRPKIKLAAPDWFTPDKFDLRQAPEFDYYLIHNPPESMEREPALATVDQLGEWTLYQRIHDLTDEP